jgi:hypothetical protein
MVKPNHPEPNKAALAQLPGQTTSAFHIMLIQFGYWLSIFFTIAFIFMVLLVSISGPDMTRGVTSGLLGIPSDTFSDDTLHAIRSVLIRAFLLLALISGLFAISLVYMRKLVRQGRDAANIARQISSEKA